MRSMANVILLCSIFVMACDNSGVNDGKEYTVKKIENTAHILDGHIDKDIWKDIELVDDFMLPWDDSEVLLTEFKAYHNGVYFVFIYQVEDTTVLYKEDWSKETDIADRVEIFMSSDPEMKNYYGMEMDPLGRVLDYSAHFYRKTDNDWDFPELELKGIITEGGYIVEGKLPLRVMKELDIIKEDGTAMIGLFRGDYERKNGRNIPHWISWVRPDSEKPDFHIPSGFGTFIFE